MEIISRLIILSSIATSILGEMDWSVKIVSGVKFQEIPHHFSYTDNFIQLFDVELPSPVLSDNPLPTNLDPTIYNLYNSALDIDTELGLRSKRFLDHGALPFIGWIQQKIGGVALSSDIDDLKVQSNKLSEYVNELKSVLNHHNDDIKLLFSEVHKLESNTILQYRETQRNMESLYNMTTSSMKLLKTDLNKIHNITTEMAYIEQFIHIYLIQVIKYEAIINSCKSGFVSENLLSYGQMRKYLQNLTNYFDQKGLDVELAIPITYLKWYFQFRISSTLGAIVT